MRTLFGFIVLLAGCSSSSFDVAGTTDSSVVDSTSAGDDASTDSAAIDSSPVDSGGSPTDAPAADTTTTETGGPKCGDPSTFPSFDKGCGGDLNCSFGLHQVDCCGSLVAVAFNHGFKASFDAAETTWRMTCPVCDCAPAPTRADDGKTGDSIGVRCSSGMCTTYVK